MTSERWQQVKDAFHEASGLSARERARYLADLDRQDPDLRQEVESLLAEDAGLDSFLETPPLPMNGSALRGLQSQTTQGDKTGSLVGPYRLVRLLGIGGMGEVYEGEDTRLGRTVAVKLLAPHLLDQREFHQRLEREARTLSRLNHPHICALYDIGQQDGADYLVMEYLQGETLEARIRRQGALPLLEATQIAMQIGRALEHAHTQGLVHRDLKPGNIMLTPTGAKLLDFGLAKPAPQWTGSLKPTTLTAHGTVMGTYHYMAPEQLEGKDADARTDIFAFGCVLYEELTGRKAFTGDSPASVIASVMEGEPEPLPSDETAIAPALQHLLSRCLAKSPANRWQSTRDLVAELEWIAHSRPTDQFRLKTRRWWQRVPPRASAAVWMSAAVVALCGAAVVAILSGRPSIGALPSAMVQILPPPDTSFVFTGQSAGSMALSPDGTYLAFVAPGPSGKAMLWLRPLNSLEATPLTGTESASSPFWSPDSQSIAFFADFHLKRVDRAGGVPAELCEVQNGRGGAWGRDDTIVFAPSVNLGLMRISARAHMGTPTPVTKLDAARQESSHRWPSLLPDGRHVLYFATAGTSEETGIYVAPVDASQPPRLVLRSVAAAVYAEPGYLLYPQDGVLLAQSFSPRTLAPEGEPQRLVDGLAMNVAIQQGVFTVSNNGLLAYQRGTLTQGGTTVNWLDRSGQRSTPIGEPALQLWPQLSPDEHRVTLAMFEPETGNEDVWVQDLARGVRTRLTFDRSNEWSPIWSPDGREIAYASNKSGKFRILTIPSDGSGKAVERLVRDGEGWPTSWSVDGRWIAYYGRPTTPHAHWQMWLLPLNGPGTPREILVNEFVQRFPVFSPDGSWLAYQSNESGQDEIYAIRFPELTGKVRLSTEGGVQPRWRRDGQELFYVSRNNRLMSIPLKGRGPNLTFAATRELFPIAPPGIPGYWYDATADGQRFLVETLPGHAKSEPITAVFGWPARVKTR